MADKVRVRIDKAGYTAALKARGWTGQRVADRLDIDKTLLSHYVNGRRDIAYSQAVRLADLLHVDVAAVIDPDSVRCAHCGNRVAA